MLDVPELPFPLVPSHPGVWRCDEPRGAVVAAAPAHTDFYLNPGGDDSADAESMLNAATLLDGVYATPEELETPHHK